MEPELILTRSMPASLVELRSLAAVLRILLIMRHHPNTLALKNVTKGPDGRVCNMHFPATSLTLLDWLSEGGRSFPGGPSSATLRLRFAQQLVSVIGFAHKNDIAHCYLTSAAVRVAEDGNVRVGGFETAKAADSPELQYICTRNYRPPEVILSINPNSSGEQHVLESVDVWAIGCLLFELVTNRGLFSLVSSRDGAGSVKPVLVKQQLTDIVAAIGTPSEEECTAAGCNARHIAFLQQKTYEPALGDRIKAEAASDVPKDQLPLWIEAIEACLKFTNSARPNVATLRKMGLFQLSGADEGEEGGAAAEAGLGPVTPQPEVTEESVEAELEGHFKGLGFSVSDLL